MSHEAATATKIQPSTPDPALKKLDVFVGKWNTKGTQIAGMVGPVAEIALIDNFEWFAGGMFLIHRFEGKIGER